MHTILIISGFVVYGGLIGVLGWRYFEIKKGASYETGDSLISVVEPKVDRIAYYIVASVSIAFRQLKILLILTIAKIMTVLKRVIIKLEKRFSKIVNQVKGKGEINQRGSVSLFLQEVKEHRDQIRSEMGK